MFALQRMLLLLVVLVPVPAPTGMRDVVLDVLDVIVDTTLVHLLQRPDHVFEVCDQRVAAASRKVFADDDCAGLSAECPYFKGAISVWTHLMSFRFPAWGAMV